MKKALTYLPITLFLVLVNAKANEIVVIGNANLPKLDEATIQKIYTGKIIALADINVKPVNYKTGSPLRNRFLQAFMNQDEEKYTAYWTVRRYIGKGTPPNELTGTKEVIDYVQSTPGAIGYIEATALTENLNVIGRK